MEFIIAGAHTYQSFLHRMADVHNPPYTPAQYQSGGWWFRRQAQRFQLTFQHIKSHQALAPDRKEDPGAAFDWKTFESSFNAATH
jgi:AmpD protein